MAAAGEKGGAGVERGTARCAAAGSGRGGGLPAAAAGPWASSSLSVRWARSTRIRRAQTRP